MNNKCVKIRRMVNLPILINLWNHIIAKTIFNFKDLFNIYPNLNTSKVPRFDDNEETY